MARNLTRNTKVYVSNQAVLGSCDDANTWEIKVLDGYNFSQATSTEDITIDEAGVAPIRGQKTYNTAIEPVDVSMSTYIRPYDNVRSVIDAPERILWASLAGSDATVTDATGDHITGTPGNGNAIVQAASGTGMTIDFDESNSNELGKLTIWFHLENTTYRVDNVNMSSCEIDFSIQDIAMLSWSGMGTAVTELTPADHTTIADTWVGGDGTGAAADYRSVPATGPTSFLRNKLSTLTVQNTEVEAVALITTLDATSGGASTLTDTGETFISDTIMAIGDYVRYSDDSYVTWETRVIQSFTEDTITIEGVWDNNPSTGAYEIYSAADRAGQNYDIAITGGSLTIENNMNFLTPEELGTVNQPLSGFAGSRSVQGNITAYLNTGFYGTSALLTDLLENINEVSNVYNIVLSIGGAAAATIRVDLALATCQLAIPTINVEDVIATEIQFAGQGSSSSIEETDEVLITYHAV